EVSVFTNRETMIKKITILFITLLIITGCTPKKEALPVASETISTPYQVMNGSTLYFYNKQYIQWKLESQYMRKPLTDTGNILVAPVKLTLYDSLGKVRTKVFSDSGITSPSMDNFTVWGDVLILTKDHMTVRSQKIWWKKKEQKVESNTYVQIKTKKGDILRGKGLTAVEDFSRFSFKSDVTGSFPDFKRRVESNEESFF
ncbi:MAG TPA: LPS export ABC transporter periplasmic protein LptC, partial [Chitinispirillaceae bacterium]|nr:LPS export ABC transporter periplasmic protein LptC [Chitinispirillaceae bacterium]